MQVSTESGTFSIDSFYKIEKLIRQNAANGFAEIWLSGDSPYPALALLINGVYACVNYFGTDEADMKMSLGSSDKSVIFKAGGVEWLSPENAVISLDEAVACAEGFFKNLDLPACMLWQDGV